MTDRLLIADVGGSYTRVRMIAGQACESERNAAVSSIDELLELLRDCLGPGGPATYGVLAVAGAVMSPDQVDLTNWPGVPRLTISRLMDCKLAAGFTLLNDMEAAAIDLAGDLARSGPTDPPMNCRELSKARPSTGNFILVAPGTGLGAVAGVAMQGGTAGLPFKVLPIEVQHTLVACPNQRWTRLWQDLGDELGRAPSWEDVVSGRGLERLFGLLGGDECRSASQIASQAEPGSNTPASQALTVYYQCAASFCQLLALTIRPHRGVFLGGESTIRNQSFLGGLELEKWFVNNPVRGRELKQLPIYLDPTSRVLEGALAMARLRVLRSIL